MTNSSLRKRLQLFTGKGGVGKSTVVAGLALHAARSGLRVLVIEINTDSAIKRIFRVPFVGFIPMEVADGIWAININPEEALLEYIEQQVKSRRIARMISGNKILRYFFKTAPAVSELVTINKIRNLVGERDRQLGRNAWDMILVDLPATGHAASFLEVPRSLMRLVGSGPLRKMLDRYAGLFSDSSLTALNLVTIPEEMPVTETIELFDRLEKTMDVPLGVLLVNAVSEKLFEEDEAELLDRLHLPLGGDDKDDLINAGLAALQRQRRSEHLLEKLATNIGLQLVTLPKLLTARLDFHQLGQLVAAFPPLVEEAR